MTSPAAGQTQRYLNYGGIRLICAFRAEFPHNCLENRDRWHIPGRTIRSTDALVRLANKKGITVVLSEHSARGVRSVRLN